MKFKDLNLHQSIEKGLQDIGYTETTPIQEQSIPVILSKKDVLGAAQTGTGKTGAFVIPVLQQILENPSEGTKVLILSPTRELAQQIDEQIFALGYHTGISSATIIGGEDFVRQANAVRAGVDIIVATPGRLLDQTRVLSVDFKHIRFLILDEADRMLDMGFLPDVNTIIDKIPKQRQTLLFSATMPKAIQKLAKDIMVAPELIQTELSKPSDSVEQQAYLIDGREKLKLTQHLLDVMEWSSCIIFTATKQGTDQLERLLTKRGITVVSIHGDRSQDERTQALNDFKNGKIPIIVATDVLARGIDIADVSLIINYDVPKAVEDYIHRIGRTGRYDKTGVAVTLVSRHDTRLFKAIEHTVGKDIKVFEGADAIKSAERPKKKTSVTVIKKEAPKETKAKKSAKEIVPDFSNLKNVKVSTNKEGKLVFELLNKKPEKKKAKSKKSQAKRELNNQKKNFQKKKTSAKKELRRPEIEFKTIDKASERNKKPGKPAKGIWGLIKSFLPRG